MFARKIVPAVSILALLLMLPATCFAWGSAVHAWLADNLGRKQGNSNFQEIYGATLPDQYDSFSDIIGYSLSMLSHSEYSTLVNAAGTCRLQAVAFGFASHNEHWGADFTAHISGRTTPGTGYVTSKIAALKPEVETHLAQAFMDAGMARSPARFYARYLSPRIAHLLVEGAMDLLVKEELDRQIGTRMLVAATNRNPDVPLLLSAAWAPLISGSGRLSPEEAGAYLSAAEEANRLQTIAYGQALIGSRARALRYLGALVSGSGSSYLSSVTRLNVLVPEELAASLVQKARGIVGADGREELLATLEYLEQAMPAYGVESCGPPTP